MDEEKEEKKIKNPLLNVIQTEWKYLGRRKKKFLFYIFLFVIASVIGLMNPLIIGLIFNSIQQSITTGAELKHLILMIFLLLATSIGSWIFLGSGRIMEELTGFFVHRNYTNSKIKKILELPVKWHKDHHSGDTIDKVNRGRNSILSVASGFTWEITNAFVNVFGALIILAFVDWKIALFAFVYSVIILFIIFKMDRKLIEHYHDLNKYSNKISSAVFD